MLFNYLDENPLDYFFKKRDSISTVISLNEMKEEKDINDKIYIFFMRCISKKYKGKNHLK